MLPAWGFKQVIRTSTNEMVTINTKVKETLAGKPAAVAQTMNTLYTSEALFRGQKEITIEHEGYQYLLRITRQNKLILTK